MRTQKRFALFGAVALCGLMLGGVAAPASAQQAVPPANPFQSLNLPPSLFFGFMGQAGGVDPTHSSAMQLLQRNDVRNEIALDLKQQNALEDLRTKSQEELQTTLKNSVQDSVKSLQSAFQNQQPGQGLDQQKDLVQGFVDQLTTTVQTFQGDLDKRTEAILRAKQATRLHELDLRWRGSLAFSDPKVAATLKLTPEQSAKVGAIVKDFMNGQQTAIMQAMTAQSKAPDQNQGAPVSPQDRVQQMQKKMMDILNSREMEKAKSEANEKLLALLTAPQKEQWTAMLGAKFTFRKTEVP